MGRGRDAMTADELNIVSYSTNIDDPPGHLHQRRNSRDHRQAHPGLRRRSHSLGHAHSQHTGQATPFAAAAAVAHPDGHATIRLANDIENGEANMKQPSDPIYEKYLEEVKADQQSKLSIFCTRPAIYNPFYNFAVEVLVTCALIYGALMLGARADILGQPE